MGKVATNDELTPLQRAFVDEVKHQAGNLAAHYAYCRVLGKMTNYGALPPGTEEVVKEIARKCRCPLL